METPEPATEQFETHRPLLLGLAYRLLGSMGDAEDIVHDAHLRWTGTERAQVPDPRAFLTTVVTRRALDRLKSARVAREAYTGPWLPEPVATDALGPLDTAAQRDTLAYATVHLMERLSPPERAVFVLREAFGLPLGEIARILDATETNCRQLHLRAGRRLAAGRDRFTLSEDDHAKLLAGFLEAAQNGDQARLADLLSEDVVAWSDGGGKVRAALWPIEGRPQVVAFATNLVARYPFGSPRRVSVNGRPALAITVDGVGQLVTIDVSEGRIDGIYAVLNPDKLGHVPG
ncbi:RNA polymerase sigma factor SigJ [Streptomyces resistomycificus]|uniref:RNA polymerase sigma factor n=1 Tax=Streptomyces resistomycificus TaxID=67356 RepID=A0A0L8LZU9_9ACTN|nr:RNA polymerase sigma factor SigJ [Streptomyces resistomycificus]KOG43693.1 RNA polymerase sigma factor [Streptomyces resistomycificus]KUO00272.1 RNA polymerase subunit sigma [Streptomyces resistomycificus]